MTATAVRVRGLTKRFGDRLAVDGADLDLPAGSVVGLVGPNGAGKTTLLRMLVGLVRPTAGHGSVLGEPLGHPARYLARVGALIEGPAFYPGRSGRANLELLARLRGAGPGAVDRALDQVRLGARAGDRFGAYSLGMRQQLGVAAALLGDPELLILDEPTNGLDPAGMRGIRALVRRRASSGATVLVSSHLLHEVEAVADHLVVMEDGRIVHQGALGAYGTTREEVEVRPLDPAEVATVEAVAREQGLAVRAEVGAVVVEADPPAVAALNRALCDRGVLIAALAPRRRSLEDRLLGEGPA